VKKAWFAALLLALGGCGNLSVGGGDGDGGEGVAAVHPSRVTQAELRAAVSDPRVVRFYEARGWQPAWNEATARSLVEAIGQAPVHALDANTFLGEAGRSDAPAAREAGLSLAALSYAEALARGRVDPKRLHADYGIPRPNPNLAAGLNQAVQQGQVAEWLAGLAPQDEEYRMLSDAYVAAARHSRGERANPIPDGAAIRPGGSDRRLAAIAEALRARGYLAAPTQEQAAPQQQPQQKQPARPAATRYTPDMVAAVRRLQEENGLEANGMIGADTLAALNQGSGDRARILAANLERRRWLPRDLPGTRIDVNTADATLTYWRDGRVVDRRRVVTGQPGNETPELLSPIFRLVANPTWTVPESIAEEEILPKGSGYMARNRMTMRDGQIVQASGPGNSLGLVKFDMRNDESIYLHDTPAKALFAQSERHRSHGCVRVQDALGFAALIAEHEGVTDDWREATAAEDETFVRLPREIPVRLLYHTAFVDGGRLRFRPDDYGWDEDLTVALGLAARPRRPRPAHTSDMGP
jgi:murein L,D-transpeptidase YcbB/YkuD